MRRTGASMHYFNPPRYKQTGSTHYRTCCTDRPNTRSACLPFTFPLACIKYPQSGSRELALLAFPFNSTYFAAIKSVFLLLFFFFFFVFFFFFFFFYCQRYCRDKFESKVKNFLEKIVNFSRMNALEWMNLDREIWFLVFNIQNWSIYKIWIIYC